MGGSWPAHQKNKYKIKKKESNMGFCDLALPSDHVARENYSVYTDYAACTPSRFPNSPAPS
jgi:hypothetical protein